MLHGAGMTRWMIHYSCESCMFDSYLSASLVLM
jgi:hypothetical protein